MSPPAKNPLLENGIVLNGKWEILEHLATGGKGEVYRARQTNLDREVVVKTVSLDYLAEFSDVPEEVGTEIKRFHREAMAMAQVRHPCVVQVYDQDSSTIVKDGEELTVRYVVMEYVPGTTLRSTMPETGFRTNEQEIQAWIRDYFLPILDGIDPIHELGIIHRDIKPENVLLGGATPKITDFGIAGGSMWPHLTRSHHVEGTILYMAPEQFTDLGESDVRADVYALGKILYEAVCGKMVDSKTACPLRSVCLGEASTPFLQGLDLIVQQATAEDKDQRTPSVKALREALLRLLEEAEAAERPLLKGLHRRQKNLIITLVVSLIGIVIASNIYHHYYMLHEMPAPPHASVLEKPQNADGERNPDHPADVPENDSQQSSLVGKNGLTMHRVPAGEVNPPDYFGADAGKSFRVASFYMDETKVTNYKYVEFLNQVLPIIAVKDGVVQGDGRPWLLLGPVFGGYEPIVYQNGRFSLKDALSAAYPVVRVTGYGASAYANFCGARLPTELEWLRATARANEPAEEASGERYEAAPGEVDLHQELEEWLAHPARKDNPRPGSFVARRPSLVPHPVMSFAPNRDGIRGLQENVSEWGMRLEVGLKLTQLYVVLGGFRGSILIGDTLVAGIAQDPAGAFVDVGFRCVRGLKDAAK